LSDEAQDTWPGSRRAATGLAWPRAGADGAFAQFEAHVIL